MGTAASRYFIRSASKSSINCSAVTAIEPDPLRTQHMQNPRCITQIHVRMWNGKGMHTWKQHGHGANAVCNGKRKATERGHRKTKGDALREEATKGMKCHSPVGIARGRQPMPLPTLRLLPQKGRREVGSKIDCLPRAIPTGVWRAKKKLLTNMAQTSSWLGTCGNADACLLT